MSYELFVQDAPKWLKQHHPDLYVKTKDVHPLLPLICVFGFDQSKPHLLPPLSFVNNPIKLKTLLGGDYEVPYDHFYSQEWKDAVKTNAHLKPNLNAAITHLIICGEDADFAFLKYFLRFSETPIGIMFAAICSESYKNRATPSGHKAHTIFCESTRLEGFLDSFNQWMFSPKEEDVNGTEGINITDLLDPKKLHDEKVWNFMALRVFSSGNPPTRDELDIFCREWVKTGRTVDNRNSIRGVLKSFWISHALWCQATDSILKLLPHIEDGDTAEDYDKATKGVNVAISRLGFTRHTEHQHQIASAIKKHEEAAEKIWGK